MNEGFILLHRRIIKEWEWYSNINDTRLWVHCLLRANWEDNWYDGILIKRGSFMTSYKSLSSETGLTIQQVRTSLAHLKKTDNLTIENNHQYSIITIKNYDKYQCEQQTNNTSITRNQQTSNKRVTTNNKDNKDNKEKINNKYIVEIVNYLNIRTGQHYKSTTDKTINLVNARLNEKFTIDDFKIVIDKMCVEWMNTDMQKYLRPETLFGTKFESYLNREVKPKKKEDNQMEILKGMYNGTIKII